MDTIWIYFCIAKQLRGINKKKLLILYIFSDVESFGTANQTKQGERKISIFFMQKLKGIVIVFPSYSSIKKR